MSDTSFTNGVTLTDADWFNDVNRLHYTIFSDPANATAAFNNISPLTIKGDIVVNDGTNDIRLAIGTDGATLIADTTEVSGLGYNFPLFQNLLINPDGKINQRVAGAGIADDVYDFDRWYTLTQTGTIAVSQVTDVADGTPSLMRMTQSQAVAQRMGRAQIIEGINCRQFRGHTFTLSVKHRISSAANLRFAVLEWTGTVDSVTSDVVLDWTSSSYATNAFFINSTIAGTVSGSIASTSSLAQTTLFGTLGSTFNNLIIFVWTEGTAAQNVTLDLAFEFTPTLSYIRTQPRSFSQELVLCQRYYEKSYNTDVAPGAAVAQGRTMYSIGGTTSAAFIATIPFKVTKRANATMVAFAPDGTSGSWHDTGGVLRAVSWNISGQNTADLSNTSGVALQGMAGHFTAVAEL